jgi:hypothetical protein
MLASFRAQNTLQAQASNTTCNTSPKLIGHLVCNGTAKHATLQPLQHSKPLLGADTQQSAHDGKLSRTATLRHVLATQPAIQLP